MPGAKLNFFPIDLGTYILNSEFNILKVSPHSCGLLFELFEICPFHTLENVPVENYDCFRSIKLSQFYLISMKQLMSLVLF